MFLFDNTFDLSFLVKLFIPVMIALFSKKWFPIGAKPFPLARISIFYKKFGSYYAEKPSTLAKIKLFSKKWIPLDGKN